MAAAALAIYVLFALLTCVWRGWLQYRRTGDHGFRRFSARIGSIEWAGGCLLTLGAGAGFVACVVEWWDGGSTYRFFLPPAVRVGGLALMVSGVAITLAAQLDMGASWRVGVDAAETTELVTTGLFRRVRNPIFAAMLLVFLGVALAVPNWIACAAFVAALAGTELHVRNVEEPYLIRTHGPRYLSYARQVGRFVPGLGRIE